MYFYGFALNIFTECLKESKKAEKIHYSEIIYAAEH